MPRMRGFAKVATISCLALTASLGMAPSAFSQEEGVTLDPGDPAAKEYALPHEEARRESGDKPKAKVQQGSRGSALFGEGVSPDSSSSTEGTDSTSSSDAKAAAEAKAKARAKAKAKARAKARAKKRAALAAAATTPPTTPEDTTPASEQASFVGGGGSDGDDGPGATAVIIGGGAAALFAALLGGFGLRAVRGPRDA